MPAWFHRQNDFHMEAYHMSLQSVEDLTLTITLEMRVRASLDATFSALLEQVGPGNETPDGKALPMTLEAWPGGR
jgi:hypothetical protein